MARAASKNTPLTLSDTRLCQTGQHRRPGNDGHWLISDDGLHRRWECNECADNKARRAARQLEAGMAAAAAGD